MVLKGFATVGDPIFTPFQSQGMMKVEKKLIHRTGQQQSPSSKRVTKELTTIPILHYQSNKLLFSSIDQNHFICWIKLLVTKLILSSKMNNNKENKLSHQATRREANHCQASCKGCFMLNFTLTIDKNPSMLMFI